MSKTSDKIAELVKAARIEQSYATSAMVISKWGTVQELLEDAYEYALEAERLQLKENSK